MTKLKQTDLHAKRITDDDNLDVLIRNTNTNTYMQKSC